MRLFRADLDERQQPVLLKGEVLRATLQNVRAHDTPASLSLPSHSPSPLPLRAIRYDIVTSPPGGQGRLNQPLHGAKVSHARRADT